MEVCYELVTTNCYQMYSQTNYQTLCTNQAICSSENRMNQQQAIEFVKEWLNKPHFHLEEDCWYSCPAGIDDDGYSNCCNDNADRRCNCGKDQRDIKLQELLDYLQGNQFPDFTQYFEFWVEE